MGKKPKTDVPNSTSVSNRDVIQRLNFLYQASVYLSNVHQSVPSEPVPSKRKKTVKLDDLSRNYIHTMKTVGTKTTVQLDPSVKRTLCKGCNTVLIPGSTASVRTKKSSGHSVVVYTCTLCKHRRRIPAAPILKPDQQHPHPAVSEMQVDSLRADADSQVESAKRGKEKKKKPPIPPRLPPLFARDAGHVVFKGNEQLPDTGGSWGDGIFIT